MKYLIATWDGAGNLQPVSSVVAALVRAGHQVHVLAHDSQRQAFEGTPATFVRYETAPQWDVGVGMGENAIATFLSFDPIAKEDFLAAVARVHPDAALIDCMMPSSLTAAKAAGCKTVALVHALYSFFADFRLGPLNGPIDAADLALGLSYQAFDPGAQLPSNFRFVGPARPELDAPPWPRRLDGKPLVLASLSSGLQSPEQQPLLQRVCDALAGLDIEALITTGRGIAPESLRPGANTTVERLVAHDAVLPHANLLITHGGHGTVMAGLRYGVPMLCVARQATADQPLNAGKVAELGLGLSLDANASTDDIRRAVERLLDDPSFRDRSRAFAQSVADQPGIERAVELVEALVKTA